MMWFLIAVLATALAFKAYMAVSEWMERRKWRRLARGH